MWISDSKGTLIRINRACTELLNISEDEVVGIYNILEDSIVKEQGLLPLVQRVFQTGETARFEITYDSSTLESLSLAKSACVILDVTVFAIRDASSAITNAVIQHIDITKRRESEEALQRANLELETRVEERTRDLSTANESLLREIAERTQAEEELSRSEQRYRLLFDQMLNGFALIEAVESAPGKTLDFRIIEINPALERMTGLRRAAVAGKTMRELFPATEATWGEQYARVARTGEAVSFHLDSRALGRQFDISAFSPQPCQVAALFNDVTERCRMEQALREREELFRTLCAAAPIGIYMSNDRGDCIYSNLRLQELTGMSAAELQGSGWGLALHPADVAETDTLWRTAAAEGRSFQHEFRLVTHGKTIWVRALAQPFRGGDGAVAGYVGVVEDITEQRRAREELLKTQKLESLGLLAGGIAHDFNNILSIILGYISLARSSVLDPQLVLTRLTDSERGVLRARDLTQQLLTFARGGDPVKRVVDLNALLREAGQFGSLGSNVRCEFDLCDEQLLVSADEGQLSQVVHNLVINAIQAMPDGGTITVRSERYHPADDGPMVRFSVTDTGTGIPEALRNKVFDPYFTTKQGSGLGLTSSYSIVKKHGGTLEVDSVPGGGSTFTVTLPSELTQAVPEPAAPALEPRGSGRVLVMDDDPLIQEVARAMLEDLGYQADCVADGEAAVERYWRQHEAGEPYVAVIMDLTVRGGMGGKDAMKALIGLDPGVKAVVSSGYSDDPVLANCRQFGFHSVLLKPYDKQQLSRALHELLAA